MKIKLMPTGQEIENDPNKTLLQVCLDNKIELKSICKGVPSCAECRVKVVAGENNLIPPAKAELSLIGTSYYLDGRRLSCQARAFGDVTLDITDHLNKDDHSNKKLRGFRVQGTQHESKAVQGTFVLEEGGKPLPPPEASRNSEPRPSREPRGQGQNQQPGQQGQSQQQAQKGEGGGNRNRNRRGGKGRGGQGRGQGQQGSGQNQNKNSGGNRPTNQS